MLSLGSGSVCDVCLESFGADLKTPCSISCGHVFCADCLHHITRQTCPLCRVSFDPRSIVKLHIDVDSVKEPSHGSSPTESTSAVQEARSLQERIAAVANAGTTEAGLRSLIADCKSFLSNQPRRLFQDLRVSLRMIAYLCEVKSTLRSQNQAVDSIAEQLEQRRAENDELHKRLGELDVARKEAVSAKRKAENERRDVHATAVQRELDLTQKVSDMQNKYIELLEQLNEVKAVNDGLREVLHSNSEAFHKEHPGYQRPGSSGPSSSNVSPETSSERSELKGLNVPEQEFMISPLPEFTSNALAPENFVGLPDEEAVIEESPEGCGAIGCPHSCDCAPLVLFSPAAAEAPSNPPSAPFTPSLLSLTAPRSDELGQRAMRSHSFSSRSNVVARPASPVIRPIQDQLPPVTMQNPTERNYIMRNHLQDLLTDTCTPPIISSSLPAPTDHHFQEGGAGSPAHRSSPPRRPAPSSSSSLENSLASLSASPISIPAVQPTASVTPAGSIPNQRSVLSRASSHAVAMENAQREKRKEHNDRRKSDKERIRDLSEMPESEQSILLSASASTKVSSSPMHHSSTDARPVLSSNKSDRESSRLSRNHSQQRDIDSASSYSTQSSNGRHVSSDSSERSRPSIPLSTKPDISSRTSKTQHDVDPATSYPPPSGGRHSSASSPAPFKAGITPSARPSRDASGYQYASSIGSAKGKVLAATMTAANTSVAGFA